MDTLVVEPARRVRRRYSEEFKRQLVEACGQPGVSVAAIALANGLNANYLRQLVRTRREEPAGNPTNAELVAAKLPAMLPVSVEAGTPSGEIRLDVRCGGTTVQIAWPLSAASGLGQCLRELLR